MSHSLQLLILPGPVLIRKDKLTSNTFYLNSITLIRHRDRDHLNLLTKGTEIIISSYKVPSVLCHFFKKS